MDLSDSKAKPVALTIAGFDPSGGAGVVADIKTFTALGCFAVAAITSLTFQNTVGVFGASHQSAETIRAQVLPVVEDFHVTCSKTGMLPTREAIIEVARLFRVANLAAPVVDPVVRSTSGYDLIDDDALSALVSELLPMARVVTPNIPEAERITGFRIEDEEGMRRAALSIRELGVRAVVIKGGHLRGDKDREMRDAQSPRSAIDLLDEEGRLTFFRGDWIESSSTHGTGCSFSAAIAACLGRGMNLEKSVEAAKSFVADAIRRAPGIGHGHGPIGIG